MAQTGKSPVKILVVDDFETVRMLFVKYLGDMNVGEVVQAENGQEAWKLMQKARDEKAPFDLVFADWNMPLMNGLELLVTLRRNKEMGTTPFVMVTSNSDDTAVVDAMRAGVSDYLVKPFDPETLRDTITRVLARIGHKAA